MAFNLSSAQSILSRATRHNDIALAFLIVAILAVMLLPLPTPLVDLLLAGNLAFSLCLLMLSMYIPSALHLSSFPALLLISTLFGLSLNIATARLILLKANAGEIILTFGNFVVGGNFIVGAVVFLIITIVQFLVITKGSERVAEVSARFSLDAMPGKQMSIDADMRAGVIDMQEAQHRRNLLAKESQLHGAMDGAMKFVKGKAIADLIITAVNIIGGLAIGILQKGMPMEKAIKTYSILTIGDGLVSQIPSLLISITAGMITTRVTSDEGEDNLGTQIGAQMLSQPKALLLGGFFLFSFALIPGFPKPQFMALGLLIGGVGYLLFKKLTEPEKEKASDIPGLAPAGEKPKPKKKTSDEDEFSITLPLIVDVAHDVQQSIKPDVLNEELLKVRKALYYDLGVPFPGIHLRFNEGLSGGNYIILVQEIPMSQGRLAPNKVIALENEENLKMLGIEYITEKQFLPNIPTIWVHENELDKLRKSNISYMDSSRIITYHLSFILKRNASEFIGLQESRYLISKMEGQFPELIKEAQRVLPLQKISEVFQRLIQEEISIRNLKNILQNLIDWGQKEKDIVLLTEYIRGGLKRYISYKYSGGQNILVAYLLDTTVEETIRKAIRQTSSGSFLALDPSTSKKFVDRVKKEVGNIHRQSNKPVLLTSMDIRRYVRKLIETDLPDLPVLSYQELSPEITIQPLGRILL